VAEIKATVDRLHIVEAELMQQLSRSEKIISQSSQSADKKLGSTGSKAKDAETYRFDGELWFDEIADMKVDLKKSCQAKR
jgi:hypothetical protein